MITISETGNPTNAIQIPSLKKPHINAVVSFYRSKEQAIGKFGVNDTSYNGEFGFDKFNKKVVAEGLIENYTRLTDVQTEVETVEGNNDYVCPYLSIWPPSVKGNIDNSKSKVTLYVQLEKDINFKNEDQNNKKANITFNSNNDALVFDNNTTSQKVIIEIGGTQQKLVIECKTEFSEEVLITATSPKSTKYPSGKIIGQLIVVPNNKRYKTTIQPVKLKLASVESKTIKKTPTKTTSDATFFNKLENDFNSTAFNQCFMQAELATDVHEITLNKNQFIQYLTSATTSGKLELKSKETAPAYNDLVEKRYAALLVNQSQSNKAAEKVKQKGQAMLEYFDKKYKYTKIGIKAAYKAYQKKLVSNIITQPKFIALRKEYQQAMDAFNALGGTEQELNKQHTIHLFYSNDIHKAYGVAAAYTSRGSGVSHLFNELLQDITLVVGTLHEIGHGLGLKHTFEKDLGTTFIRESGKVYEQDIKKEIEELEKEIKVLVNNKIKLKENNKLILKEKLNPNQILYLKQLQVNYMGLERSLKFKNSFNENLSQYEIFFISKIDQLKILENNSLGSGQGNIETITQIEQKIAILESDLAKKKLELKAKTTTEASKLSKIKEQSTTKENYMDYNLDANGNKIKDMKRIMFYKQQWDTMREITESFKYFKSI